MGFGSGREPHVIDLLHRERERVIGAWLVGDVIVDPGPASCLERLLAALGRQEPRALALTHIHLDHAGASGSLARMFPRMEVWVHERGAPHLADPSRLLASAERLYGERMGELWGEMLPVPAERLRILRGGESRAGLRVEYTPGHASHHVAYLHGDSGIAFTGDVAGVRISGGPVIAPTPPPDIDLEAWGRSLQTLESWEPHALALTHFGLVEDVEDHLARMRGALEFAAEAASFDGERFAAEVRARVQAQADAGTAALYELATPPSQSYAGLRRYLERSAAA
jgi:glyoxylase-like metal-dependent hydrolase (beta-lactamase superfamily II)